MQRILVRIVSFILLLVVIATSCSCTVQTLINDTTSNTTQGQNLSLLSSVQLSDSELEPEDDSIPRVEAYEFIVFSIMNDMSFDEETIVKKAYAVVGEKLIPGVMAYSGDTVDEYKAAAFVQIVDLNEDDGYRITDEQVEAGLCVLPIDEEEAYVVNAYAKIPSFSVVYNDYYLIYKQTDNYVVEISCEKNSKDIRYDETVDLYNMDESSWIFKNTVEFDENNYSVLSMYSNEAQAIATAKQTFEKIVQLQNENSNSSEIKTLILIAEDVLEQAILSNQQGTVNGFSLKALEGIELKSDEIIVITSEGIKIERIPEIVANERKVNGIIGLISSTLMLAGSIAIAVATYGAGSGLVISSIAFVSAGVASIYSTSNIISSISDIYYGSINDIYTESYNPVLNLLKKQIKDPDKATKMYHAIGISASILQALTIPAQGALKISASSGAGYFKTTLNVTRAVLTESVKIAATTGTAIFVSGKVNEFMDSQTDVYLLKQITTFASSILAGAFVYGGLTSIDKSLNISGLYPKTEFLKGYSKITEADALSKFEKNSWSKLSDYEKKLAIRKMVGEISDDLGLNKTPGIRYFRKNNDTLGYSDGKNIYINLKYFDNGTELLNTVAHELCHVKQYQDCLKGVISEITDNYKNYIEYDKSLGNYDMYYNQPVEVQARNYAEIWVNMINGK